MAIVSVIVPVFNVERYLCPCVDSILAQTFSDFELILVDDGSPDRCGAICDEYAAKDRRIRVIHQQNGGLSAARNAGLDWMFANSDSKWVTFVDSDDLIHPQMLEQLYSLTEKYEAQIAICKFKRFQTELPEPDVSEFPNEIFVCTGKEACHKMNDPGGVQYITACGKLFLASLYADLRFPVGRVHEDEAVTHRFLFAADRVAVCNAELYLYRMTAGSITNQGFSLKKYDYIAALEDRILFFTQQGEADLAEIARKKCSLALASYSIRAKHAGFYQNVPSAYKVCLPKALRIIRKNSDPSYYEWHLSLLPARLSGILKTIFVIRRHLKF